MILASNTEIEVDGYTLMSGMDEVFTVKLKAGATSTYVDIDYNSVLGIPTTRYWFDQDGEVVLPMGDLARAMVDGGVSGTGITVMTVTDEATQTALAVACNVFEGIVPVTGGPAFPPRKCIYIGAGMSVPFVGNPLVTENYDIYTSTDGATWTGPTTVTTDTSHHEALVSLPSTSSHIFTKICRSGETEPLWQCKQRRDWCGDFAYFEWKSDSGKTKRWCFEVVSVDREVKDTRTTEGSGVFRGSFFPTAKNWVLSATVKVRDLEDDETWYFDDFVTGEITGSSIQSYVAMSYVAAYGASPWAARVTDKKVSRPVVGATSDLTFKVELMQVRNY